MQTLRQAAMLLTTPLPVKIDKARAWVGRQLAAAPYRLCVALLLLSAWETLFLPTEPLDPLHGTGQKWQVPTYSQGW